MKRTILLTFSAVITVMAIAGTAVAQSSDRDNPTPLNSSDISGSMNDHNKEHFYSFMAGPGEVTVTLDVNANRDEQGLLNFDVLARNGGTSVACCYFAQGNGGGTGREVANFKLGKRQVVILHTTNGPIGGGTFRIRLSGAVAFGSSSTDGRVYSDGGNIDQPVRGNRGGEQVSVPATGTLHIRMKNGTAKDIDLSLIQNITVRQ